MPNTQLDMYATNKQDPIGFAKTALLQDVLKDEILKQINEQTVNLIYNKRSRQIEEFSPEQEYEDRDNDSVLFMHTVFGLQNADEVDYTPEEMVRLLGFLPKVKRDLQQLNYKI